MAEQTIVVAGVVRPHPTETVSGDAWTVQWYDGVCRIAVIDALGHGPEAAKVATRAVEALQSHPDLAPAQALSLCDRALAGTRGAAISIASIDPTASALTFTGIGNVEAQVLMPDRVERPVVFRGIIGAQHRAARTEVLPLRPGWVLLIHTDGVSSRVPLREALTEQQGRTLDQYLQEMAYSILGRWSRAHDDATVVLAGPQS